MKRKLPPHIVLPDGRWRFVKRGSRSAKRSRSAKLSYPKRRTISMAKRGRRSYSGRRGGMFGGGIKSMIIPIGAGAADSILNPMLPINGVGSTMIGIVGHNETIKNIGLWQVGASLPGMLMPNGIGGIKPGVYL